MLEQQIEINEVLKSLREEIGMKAQEIAILKATLLKLTEQPKKPKTTTAVTNRPDVNGPKGI